MRYGLWTPLATRGQCGRYSFMVILVYCWQYFTTFACLFEMDKYDDSMMRPKKVDGASEFYV